MQPRRHAGWGEIESDKLYRETGFNKTIGIMQILGRGARPCDGRDYVTLYDVVKAHPHLSDPERDGGGAMRLVEDCFCRTLADKGRHTR